MAASPGADAEPGIDAQSSTETVHSLSRPHSNLLKYYFLGSLFLGPFFLVALIPLYFRYHTLRYRFDDEGVSMRWGILFRREISLTYSRLQDIHLQSNLIERWLGLAKVQLQTASGSSGAEMTIEGLQEFEEVRNYLYSQMRGARRDHQVGTAPQHAGSAAAEQSSLSAGGELSAVVQALEAVAGELRCLREDLAAEGDDR